MTQPLPRAASVSYVSRKARGRTRRFVSGILSVFLLLVFSACSAPRADISTDDGREAIYSATLAALTRGDCDIAIGTIDPLYQSKYSTNRARFLRSSAYACRAGMNFFSVVDQLTRADLSGSGFWKAMAQLFPDPSNRMEASWQASDSLLSVLREGTYVTTSNRITSNDYNLGTIVASERTMESNTFLVFTSMAAIGTAENRYGSPTSSYDQGVDFTWTTPAAVDATGCAFASAIMNLLDAINEVKTSATGSLATSLNTIASLQAGFNVACGGTCTTALHDRATCTGATSQSNIDAAAIVTVVNASWL